jgi:hypothetical protein
MPRRRSKPAAKKRAKPKKRTKRLPKKPDVRGYIIRPEHPEEYGYTEKGHLEGNDALSALPEDVRAAMLKAIKDGQFTLRRVNSPEE